MALKRLVINDLQWSIYAVGFCKHVSLELEKHAVSGSLLNVLREKPLKIALVQYTEA